MPSKRSAQAMPVTQLGPCAVNHSVLHRLRIPRDSRSADLHAHRTGEFSQIVFGVDPPAVEPIDLHEALSYESKIWEFSLHGVEDLDRRILTPEEVNKMAEEIPHIVSRRAREPCDDAPVGGPIGAAGQEIFARPWLHGGKA